MKIEDFLNLCVLLKKVLVNLEISNRLKKAFVTFVVRNFIIQIKL